MSGAIYTFPSKQLNARSCILIKGYGNTQTIIDSLTIDYPIFLESKNNHKVNLIVEDSNKSRFRVNQALLKPQEELIIGEAYSLKVDNLEVTKNSKTPCNLGILKINLFHEQFMWVLKNNFPNS